MHWQSEGEPAGATSRDMTANGAGGVGPRPEAGGQSSGEADNLSAREPASQAQEPAGEQSAEQEPAGRETPGAGEEKEPDAGEAQEDLASRFERLSADYQALSGEHQRLQESHRQLWDSMLRLKADFDNYRRRTREEAARLEQEGAYKVIVDLLPVVDNMERALKAAEAEAGREASGAAAVEGIRSGVAMILQQLQRVLEKYGVEPVPGVGEPFDPRWHEAVAREEPEAGEASGTDGQQGPSDGPLVVVEEFQKGYRAGDKVLRASMVKVGTGKVQPG